MGNKINQKKFENKTQNLIDFASSEIGPTMNHSPRVINHPTYRCVLGCTLNGNSTSRSSWDVRLIKKEESKSLVLERR